MADPTYTTEAIVRALQPSLDTNAIGNTALNTLITTFARPTVNSDLGREYFVPFDDTDLHTEVPETVTVLSSYFALSLALDTKYGRVGPGTKSSQGNWAENRYRAMVKSIIAGKAEMYYSDGTVVPRKAALVVKTELGEEDHTDRVIQGDEASWNPDRYGSAGTLDEDA